jgi:hypothetical protein
MNRILHADLYGLQGPGYLLRFYCVAYGVGIIGSE